VGYRLGVRSLKVERMPQSDYPGRIILLGFFFDNGKAGTAEERQELSQDLFDSFDEQIKKECSNTTPPIDPSAEIRATLAVMAEHAPGNSKAKRVQRAVEAYFEFRGM
jgi:hypothetical protein